MNHDDEGQEHVRTALNLPEERDARAAAVIASTAIDRGTRRILAHASTRAATLGLAISISVAFGVYEWEQAEASRTAGATLLHGVAWTP